MSDSRNSTPSVMSIDRAKVSDGGRRAAQGRLTLDHGLVAGAVLETDDISDFTAELALGRRDGQPVSFVSYHRRAHLHLLRDTLCYTHGSDTTRLSTSDETELAVALLVQELGELSRLSGARLADTNDDCKEGAGRLANGRADTAVKRTLILANDVEKGLSRRESGEILPLLLESLVAREGRSARSSCL